MLNQHIFPRLFAILAEKTNCNTIDRVFHALSLIREIVVQHTTLVLRLDFTLDIAACVTAHRITGLILVPTLINE